MQSIISSKLARAAGIAALSLLVIAPSLALADTELFTTNPGFESDSAGWTQGDPTGITAAYSVITGGHTGNAGNISVSAVSGGEAKWLTPFISVTPGQVINFSDWYKSDVLTSVFVYPSGPVAPTWIGDAATSSAAFAQFHGQTYLVPPGITLIQIGHAISAVGSLTTDDYSALLSSAPTEFAQGIVTLTFDDGWQSFWDIATSSLNVHNFKSTNYIVTGPDGSNVTSGVPNNDYMSAAEITQLFNSGYDINDHTNGHLDLAKDDPVAHGYADRNALWQGEINNSIAALRTLLPSAPLDSFAYPYGSYCAPTLSDCVSTTVQNPGAVNVMAAIKAAGLKAARSVDAGYELAGDLTNDNIYKLKTQHVTNATTAADINSWINYARDNKVWLILMFHNVRPAGTSTVYTAGSQNPACIEPVLDPITGQEVVPAQFEPDLDCTTNEVLADSMNYLATQPTVSVLTMHQVLTNQVPAFINPHTDVFAEATSSAGAVVIYTNPTATNNLVVTCAPPSGANFSIGSTTVNCTATGAATTTFAVGVHDTTKPVVTLNGSSTVNLIIGDTYTELGATATDAVTASTSLVMGSSTTIGGVATSSVNTNALGTYLVKYTAADAAGNIGSTTRTIVVADKPAPVISGQGAGSPSQTSLVVSWTTDHPSTSRVVYDTSSVTDASSTAAGAPNYGYANSTTEDATLTTSHSVTVGDLTANTTYYFRTVSHGSPESVSAELSAATQAVPSGGGGGGSSGGGGGGGGGGYILPIVPTTGIVLGTSTQSTVANSSNTGGSCYTFTRTLSVGSAGPDVTQLQTALTALGFYSGPITGHFGPLTFAGVKKFQAANGIVQVGVVGPLTRAALNACTAAPVAPATGGGTVLGASTTAFTKTLTLGSSGDEVTILQNRLTAEGFYNGPVTGYFGPLTQAAVKAYQAAHGLPSTGLVGPLTRAALNGQ